MAQLAAGNLGTASTRIILTYPTGAAILDARDIGVWRFRCRVLAPSFLDTLTSANYVNSATGPYSLAFLMSSEIGLALEK